MPKKVGSFSALESAIKQAVIDTVNKDLKDETIKTVKEHIQTDVYNAYSPEVYKRTHTLENSLVGNTRINNAGSQILLTVEHDEDKMQYSSVMPDRYVIENQEAVVDWIVSGDVHNLWNDDPSSAYLNPRPYMENSENEILEKVDEIIREGISKRLR